MQIIATLLTLGALLTSTVTIAQSEYAIVPDSVSLRMRVQWCTQQRTQCPLICLETSAASSQTESNVCDAHTLTYSCICSNLRSPNVTEYSQTLPYFICTEWGTQCVANCGTDNLCAAACRQDHPCGATDPRRPNTSTISTTRSVSKTVGSVSTTMTTTKSGNAAGGTVCTGFGAGSCSQATTTSEADSASKGTTSLAVRGLSLMHSSETVGVALLVGAVFLGFALVL